MVGWGGGKAVSDAGRKVGIGWAGRQSCREGGRYRMGGKGGGRYRREKGRSRMDDGQRRGSCWRLKVQRQRRHGLVTCLYLFIHSFTRWCRVVYFLAYIYTGYFSTSNNY